MNSPPVAHVVGAGVAGLSAAVRLAEAGWPVYVYEASAQAGGRCRSYFDETLGCRIDNGNHLLLSGNRSAMRYLETIGAADSLVGPSEADFPFFDLKTRERWHVRPRGGPLSPWMFDATRRVARTRGVDYLAGLRLAAAGQDATVAEILGPDSVLYRRFWEPLAVAILNTEASEAAAHLLWPVLRETFGHGAKHCLPRIVRTGLSESFVYPALAYLEEHHGKVRFGARVRGLTLRENSCVGLELPDATVPLGPRDVLVLAAPPVGAAQLLPGLVVPEDFRSIVNAHFRYDSGGPDSAEEVSLLGLIGGTAEWIFQRKSLLSVTVSAATRIIDGNADELADVIWREVALALDLPPGPMPPARIVKEKRATFAQTPAQIRRRPPTDTGWKNVALAGDWTNTGLPATIEGAIRSGERAAQYLLGR